MLNFQQPETAFAQQAILAAAQLIQTIQSKTVPQALSKEDRSPVTVADYASQALIAAMLREHFPHDVLVAEEGAAALRQPAAKDILHQVDHFVSQFNPTATPEKVCDWIDHGTSQPANRFWTLDPIDGTKGFLRGDQYAVALALLENNQVQIGALGCPNLKLSILGNQAGCIVLAVEDEGAWAAPLQNPTAFVSLRVSSLSDITQARLLRSFESGHTNVSQIEMLSQYLNIQAAPLRLDSQAKYALLAAGEGEIILRLISPHQRDYREKIWDHAAGSIILKEAGGKISDLDGKALDFSCGRTLDHNRGLLASNGLLHQAVLTALQALHI